MIRHQRTQHAVGQGFFHSADIDNLAGGRIRYVYDCGAMEKFRGDLDRSVENYLDDVGKGAKLDFLFISHAHFDHVSGLPKLLNTASGGVKVDTIVMPLMDVYDRLIIFAKAASEDVAVGQNAFYRSFVADPVATLGGFNPREILLVTRGNDPESAPGSDVPGEPEPLSPRDTISVKLIGTGSIRQMPTTATAGPAVRTMPDTRYVAISVEPLSWLLSPFVDPTVNASRSRFRASLASQLKISTRGLGRWLRSSRNRINLLTTKRETLEKAYKAITSDVNITSMSLFSSPLPSSYTPFFDHRWSAGRFRGYACQGSVAWLATGDAALKQKGRRRSMLNHYRFLLPSVVSLTLPHHGAEANYHEELVRRIDPCFCVVAADHYSKTWHHPGAQVVHSVASHGSLLLNVTANPCSEFREVAHFH